jgi:hypothetical protein
MISVIQGTGAAVPAWPWFGREVGVLDRDLLKQSVQVITRMHDQERGPDTDKITCPSTSTVEVLL